MDSMAEIRLTIYPFASLIRATDLRMDELLFNEGSWTPWAGIVDPVYGLWTYSTGFPNRFSLRKIILYSGKPQPSYKEAPAFLNNYFWLSFQ
jgi:hypothetical protein